MICLRLQGADVIEGCNADVLIGGEDVYSSITASELGCADVSKNTFSKTNDVGAVVLEVRCLP